MRHFHDRAQVLSWLETLSPKRSARWVIDSRQVQPGDVFIAWPGAAHDARRFVKTALERGAVACLMEAQGFEAHAELLSCADPRVATLPHLKQHLGELASAWFGHPSRALDMVAVTGTNGKTSTTWWLSQALAHPALQRSGPCAVVGTLGVGIPPQVQSTGLTTPDPVLLQRMLREWADAGLSACAMEASSIGIEEHRLDGLHLRLAVFTNFTQDHLDYHGSMERYWAAKAKLFAWPGLQAAVLNADAPETQRLLASLAPGVQVWTFGLHHSARLQARALRHEAQGMSFDVCEGDPSGGAQTLRLHTTAQGEFNVSNLLAVVACLRALGHDLPSAVQACARLLPVPGRLQCVDMPGDAASNCGANRKTSPETSLEGNRAAAPDGDRVDEPDDRADLPMVCVDYAHTPDALEKALTALRPAAQARGGQLWCVFGCGGDRDPIKRPLMAAMAERHADRVMLTSDNPRSEDPRLILSQVLHGFARSQDVEVNIDRASAIAEVIAQAAAQDVILLAGKGHEDYQEVAGQRHPFSDFAHAQAALRQRLATPVPASAPSSDPSSKAASGHPCHDVAGGPSHSSGA